MRKISFSPPDISEAEIAGAVSALRSGWITTGQKTKLFEERIAAYCGTNRAVCLNSCTAALELTLRLLGVGPGDEVITSAYTYTASASVIAHVGASIVLVDTADGGFHMDYGKLADAITPRTKAVIPVDIGGVMYDYDGLSAVLESKKHLFRSNGNKYLDAFDRPVILADAAHSFGATYHGKRSGAVADFSCFSFHAVKNLTTAEGGAVTWIDRPGLDNGELYRDFMLISLHGQSKDALSKLKPGRWEYDIVTLGYKCNMTDIMAALGLVQMERYPQMLKRRYEMVERYNKAIDDLNANLDADHQVRYLNHKSDDHCGSHHLYIVRLTGRSREEASRVIEKMAERDIACNVHYKPLPMMAAYKALGFDIANYPNAFHLFENEITLPLHTCMTDEMQEYVIKNFVEIVKDL